MNNPFWEYSIQQYARQGVADACLCLQDRHGLDVNLLLYGGWLASLGQMPDEDHVLGLAREVQLWREQVVQPLRSLRRQWKGLAPAAELRERLQALELQAERLQQDAMLAFYHRHPAAAIDAPDVEGILVLIARCTIGRGQEWEPLMAHLAGLLEHGIGLESTEGG